MTLPKNFLAFANILSPIRPIDYVILLRPNGKLGNWQRLVGHSGRDWSDGLRVKAVCAG
jgi:hypothetical protein